MNKSVVTAKGQIVIPFKLRRRHRIRKGMTVYFRDQGNSLLVTPCTDEHIEGLKGILKTKGKALKALLAEKKKEREL